MEYPRSRAPLANFLFAQYVEQGTCHLSLYISAEKGVNVQLSMDDVKKMIENLQQAVEVANQAKETVQ